MKIVTQSFRFNPFIVLSLLLLACSFSFCDSGNESAEKSMSSKQLKAEDILGNPEYRAISYGGYRHDSRLIQPTIEELKEDLLLLNAMGFKVLRTYNVHLDQAANLLLAIKEMKSADPSFEMYVMLGAWIDCLGARTDTIIHSEEDSVANREEIDRAVELANLYPEIVKVIAVGNEAMIRWAANYFVEPKFILKWVNHLQGLKREGKLPKDLWITSSDNFASWGGGHPSYHTLDLEELVKAVDFISMHTYPMHDTHHNPSFWYLTEQERSLDENEQIKALMNKSVRSAKSQYFRVEAYLKSIDVNKPIHVGESGWASVSNGYFGEKGSRACDEYKQALYYQMMREWTDRDSISCFFFEAFNESWKDSINHFGSENHFGLFTIDGQAKYAIWDEVDEGVFDGLKRNGNGISKTYNGVESELMKDVFIPNKK